MIKTEWKPKDEIAYSLEKAKRVSILSCDGCAEQCGTGGMPGMKGLKVLLEGWGKEVLSAEVVEECCDESLMQQALTASSEAISRCDALVIDSCASGVKAACLCAPGVSVVAVLDTLGGAVFTERDNLVVNSLCKVCGHCVITYTGGICPVTACPAKNKYAPCNKSPKNGSRCFVDPDRSCAWKEIAERGDPAALKNLRQMHTDGG